MTTAPHLDSTNCQPMWDRLSSRSCRRYPSRFTDSKVRPTDFFNRLLDPARSNVLAGRAAILSPSISRAAGGMQSWRAGSLRDPTRSRAVRQLTRLKARLSEPRL